MNYLWGVSQHVAAVSSNVAYPARTAAEAASNLAYRLVPSVADYKWSARSADFDAWLLCDGRALLRTSYPELFDVIGTSFGATGGSAYFNLPDARGKAAAAAGGSHVMGDSVGAETHALTETEMPSHTHDGTTSTAAGHTHTYQDAYFAENIGGGANNVFGTSGTTDTDNTMRYRTTTNGSSSTPVDLATGTAGAHSHTFTTASTGGGAAISLMQPTLFMGNVFIYSGTTSSPDPI